MNTHNTQIELCGEEYAARVLFEWDKSPLISSVALCRKVKEFYNAAGDYEPRVTLIFLAITPLLDETPCSALAGEIMAEATRRKAEATAESQEWARAAL